MTDRCATAALKHAAIPAAVAVLLFFPGAADPQTGQRFDWELHGPPPPRAPMFEPPEHLPRGIELGHAPLAAEPSSTLASEPLPPRLSDAPAVVRSAPAIVRLPSIRMAPTETRTGQPPVDAAIAGSPSRTAPPPAAARPTSSPAMQAVLRDAEAHCRRGVELGNRQAWFSARTELLQALRKIAQALDAEAGTERHSQALANGLRALEEADDFIPQPSGLEADLNVPMLASVHRTPVVRDADEELSPLAARQRYYTYAQDQLAASMGDLPAGSAALESLGKLYTVLADHTSPGILEPEPKALVLHQAALIVDSQNAVAANELGVMLARLGRYPEARAWLQQSVAVAPQPAAWHNLAVVHQHLGEVDLAQQALALEMAARQRPGNPAAAQLPQVQWVAPQVFSAAAPGSLAPPHAPAARPAARTAAPQSHPQSLWGREATVRLPRLDPRWE